MKIINILRSSDASIAYIEFIDDDTKKILNYEHFINRYGVKAIASYL